MEGMRMRSRRDSGDSSSEGDDSRTGRRQQRRIRVQRVSDDDEALPAPRLKAQDEPRHITHRDSSSSWRLRKVSGLAEETAPGGSGTSHNHDDRGQETASRDVNTDIEEGECSDNEDDEEEGSTHVAPIPSGLSLLIASRRPLDYEVHSAKRRRRISPHAVSESIPRSCPSPLLPLHCLPPPPPPPPPEHLRFSAVRCVAPSPSTACLPSSSPSASSSVGLCVPSPSASPPPPPPVEDFEEGEAPEDEEEPGEARHKEPEPVASTSSPSFSPRLVFSSASDSCFIEFSRPSLLGSPPKHLLSLNAPEPEPSVKESASATVTPTKTPRVSNDDSDQRSTQDAKTKDITAKATGSPKETGTPSQSTELIIPRKRKLADTVNKQKSQRPVSIPEEAPLKKEVASRVLNQRKQPHQISKRPTYRNRSRARASDHGSSDSDDWLLEGETRPRSAKSGRAPDRERQKEQRSEIVDTSLPDSAVGTKSSESTRGSSEGKGADLSSRHNTEGNRDSQRETKSPVVRRTAKEPTSQKTRNIIGDRDRKENVQGGSVADVRRRDDVKKKSKNFTLELALKEISRRRENVDTAASVSASSRNQAKRLCSPEERRKIVIDNDGCRKRSFADNKPPPLAISREDDSEQLNSYEISESTAPVRRTRSEKEATSEKQEARGSQNRELQRTREISRDLGQLKEATTGLLPTGRRRFTDLIATDIPRRCGPELRRRTLEKKEETARRRKLDTTNGGTEKKETDKKETGKSRSRSKIDTARKSDIEKSISEATEILEANRAGENKAPTNSTSKQHKSDSESVEKKATEALKCEEVTEKSTTQVPSLPQAETPAAKVCQIQELHREAPSNVKSSDSERSEPSTRVVGGEAPDGHRGPRKDNHEVPIIKGEESHSLICDAHTDKVSQLQETNSEFLDTPHQSNITHREDEEAEGTSSASDLQVNEVTVDHSAFYATAPDENAQLLVQGDESKAAEAPLERVDVVRGMNEIRELRAEQEVAEGYHGEPIGADCESSPERRSDGPRIPDTKSADSLLAASTVLSEMMSKGKCESNKEDGIVASGEDAANVRLVDTRQDVSDLPHKEEEGTHEAGQQGSAKSIEAAPASIVTSQYDTLTGKETQSSTPECHDHLNINDQLTSTSSPIKQEVETGGAATQDSAAKNLSHTEPNSCKVAIDTFPAIPRKTVKALTPVTDHEEGEVEEDDEEGTETLGNSEGLRSMLALLSSRACVKTEEEITPIVSNPPREFATNITVTRREEEARPLCDVASVPSRSGVVTPSLPPPPPCPKPKADRDAVLEESNPLIESTAKANKTSQQETHIPKSPQKLATSPTVETPKVSDSMPPDKPKAKRRKATIKLSSGDVTEASAVSSGVVSPAASSTNSSRKKRRTALSDARRILAVVTNTASTRLTIKPETETPAVVTKSSRPASSSSRKKRPPIVLKTSEATEASLSNNSDVAVASTTTAVVKKKVESVEAKKLEKTKKSDAEGSVKKIILPSTTAAVASSSKSTPAVPYKPTKLCLSDLLSSEVDESSAAPQSDSVPPPPTIEEIINARASAELAAVVQAANKALPLLVMPSGTPGEAPAWLDEFVAAAPKVPSPSLTHSAQATPISARTSESLTVRNAPCSRTSSVVPTSSKTKKVRSKKPTLVIPTLTVSTTVTAPSLPIVQPSTISKPSSNSNSQSTPPQLPSQAPSQTTTAHPTPTPTPSASTRLVVPPSVESKYPWPLSSAKSAAVTQTSDPIPPAVAHRSPSSHTSKVATQTALPLMRRPRIQKSWTSQSPLLLSWKSSARNATFSPTLGTSVIADAMPFDFPAIHLNEAHFRFVYSDPSSGTPVSSERRRSASANENSSVSYTSLPSPSPSPQRSISSMVNELESQVRLKVLRERQSQNLMTLMGWMEQQEAIDYESILVDETGLPPIRVDSSDSEIEQQATELAAHSDQGDEEETAVINEPRYFWGPPDPSTNVLESLKDVEEDDVQGDETLVTVATLAEMFRRRDALRAAAIDSLSLRSSRKRQHADSAADDEEPPSSVQITLIQGCDDESASDEDVLSQIERSIVGHLHDFDRGSSHPTKRRRQNSLHV